MPDLPSSLKRTPALDRWVAIDHDGTIRIRTGKVEIGQGILSALRLIAADELEVHPSKVRVETAVTGRSPNELITAGSMSVEDSGSAVRQACAHAKRHLLASASQQLGTAARDLVVEDGAIVSPGANRWLTYAELQGGKPFGVTIAEAIPEKDPSRYRWVGTFQPRIDLAGKLRGEGAFVHDLAPQDVLHARVVRPPGYHHRLEHLDRAMVESMPGLHALIVDGSFVAVLAEDEFVAVRAMERAARAAVWRRQRPIADVADLGRYLKDHETSAYPVVDGVASDGPIPDWPEPRPGERVVAATYTRPYVMHASLVPSAAVALWRDDQLFVWSASQGIEILRPVLAEALGIPADRVTVGHSQGAGAYGHNGADDAAIDAALCARAVPGRYVSMKWTRAQEHGWEPYGPAMRMSLEARVGADGRITAWSHDVWSFTHMGRPMPGRLDAVATWHRSSPVERPAPAPRLGPEVGIHRNAWPAYRFDRMRVVKRFVAASPLRTSSLRGLGAQGNVFAIESFFDEVAAAIGADPIAHRLAHLEDPRARAVIERVVAEGGGGPGRRESRGDVSVGRGLGYARYKNRQCYAAVMVDVAVNLVDASIGVETVWIAADAGCAIDPDGLVNQLEGGAIQAISWTLKEAVRFDADGITSLDWDSYPILRFDEVPDVHTAIIDRQHERALGAGEATQGPTTAAVANAIFHATGLRVRDLPITAERLREAAARS
jgi:CO/xanthine dehydrogenase Mo-binding subunit